MKSSIPATPYWRDSGLALGTHPRWYESFYSLRFIIAAILLASMVFELPNIDDFSLFGFYDPGTTLKGDWLISHGLIPTIDFGYTHGLIPLVIGRVGFSILGRTPGAYLFITALIEVCISASIARIAIALKLSQTSLFFLLCALPIAIQPSYLTLAHVTEAAFLLWSLSEQARGHRPQALAICTACVFVKPSMAYVYGFILLLLTLRDWRRCGGSFRDLFARTRHAMLVAIILPLLLALRFGFPPLWRTLLPLTGIRTYADTGFGFFFGTGTQFWSPRYHDIAYYLYTPAGIWLALFIILTVVVVFIAFHARRLPVLTTELLLTIAILHLAFVCGFYGWPQSWTYYSYLPVLFVTITLSCFQWKPNLIAPLCLLAIAGQSRNLELAINGWLYKSRSAAMMDLFIYQHQLAAWNQVRQQLADTGPTIILTYGYLTHLPANVHMPLTWFPEPGIPTRIEMANLRNQIRTSRTVITWNAYGRVDIWNRPSLVKLRAHFVRKLHNSYFSLWQRIVRISPP